VRHEGTVKGSSREEAGEIADWGLGIADLKTGDNGDNPDSESGIPNRDSLFSLFPPIQEFFICVHPRHPRANALSSICGQSAPVFGRDKMAHSCGYSTKSLYIPKRLQPWIFEPFAPFLRQIIASTYP
jgi:hypothetical protein